VKSQTNKEKHGIDFEEAQALWDDEEQFIQEIVSDDENRLIHTGKIGDKYYTAVTTAREGNIRIISVRRARAKEILDYGQTDNR
jgi:uncharacterized DUF497 family protein